MRVIYFTFVSLLIASTLFGQIILDESYYDWDTVSIWYEDVADDSLYDLAFKNFKMSADNDYIYFYLELNRSILLQGNNGITLYIDSDNNSATGKIVDGIGAEIEYFFGERFGYYYSASGSTKIWHSDIGLITMPTVSSDRFEILLNRNSQVNTETIFTADTISIIIKDGDNGDRIPNESDRLTVELPVKQTVQFPFTLKKDLSSFRVVTFNVLRDNLFEPSLKENFSRIIKALNPDIIAFQEIYNHNAEETKNIVNEFIPGTWYASSTGNDNICVSKYPIDNAISIDRNSAFSIDIRSDFGTKLFLISAHLPCCSNDEGRQNEADNIMSLIRDAKAGMADINLEYYQPFLIVGDMNLVGDSRVRDTFISGDIFDNQTYGNDFMPDWDGTELEDVKPLTTGMPATFTWYDEGSSYSPGRLDYIFYSGSSVYDINSFTFFSPALSDSLLNEIGVQQDDSKIASDHLPVVADFQIIIQESVGDKGINPHEFYMSSNYPNPFNPSTTIEFNIPANINGIAESVSLKVYNIMGELVKTIIDKKKISGYHSVKFDASGLPSGVYIYKLQAGGKSISKKMTLLK